MERFRVTYLGDKTETVKADLYSEVKNWIVFYERNLPERDVELLRIKASHILRVERLSDEGEAD